MAKNNIHLPSHSSVGQKAKLAQLVSLFQVSQGQNQGSRAVFLPEALGMNRFQAHFMLPRLFFAVVGLRIPVSLLAIGQRSSLAPPTFLDS